MKVLAINSSPRHKGNTYHLLETVLAEVRNAGIATELVQLGGQPAQGCIACYQCYETRDLRCTQDDGALNELLARMAAADGILLGSPVYVSDVTPELKAFLDRAALVVRASGQPLKRKVGAGVVAVRRGGAIHALDTINHFFQITQMIVPGSSYWNFGLGKGIGEVAADEEGLQCMRDLGQNMAWLLQKLNT
jgi:multimeric flavodoxin WrbA